MAIAGRAARIREQHRVAPGGIDLKLVIPIDAVLPRWSAVNAQDHGIFLALLPIDRFDKKTVDVPIVRALISETFDIRQLQLLPQRFIQIG